MEGTAQRVKKRDFLEIGERLQGAVQSVLLKH